MQALAELAGQLVTYTGAGAAIGLNHVTTQRYMSVFEQLFLVRALPSCHGNALKRLTKRPKLHFLDSGLLAALRGVTPERLARDRGSMGAILETFVFCELLKLSGWSAERLTFSHYRDKDLCEVDLVLEDRRGRVAGIEVKAAATVISNDFRGLRRLAEAVGERFCDGPGALRPRSPRTLGRVTAGPSVVEFVVRSNGGQGRLRGRLTALTRLSLRPNSLKASERV